MHRVGWALLALAGWASGLAGCQGVAPPFRAHSERTGTAYPHPVVERDYADQRLREYTRQLEQILADKPPEPPTGEPLIVQPQASPLRPRPVDLLPFEPQDYTPSAQRNPLDGPVRAVGPILAAPGVLAGDAGVPASQPASAPAAASAPADDELLAHYLDAAYVESLADKNPEDLELQLKSRLLLLAGRHDEQALKPVPGLSEQENQTVAALLHMMMTVRDHKAGAPASPDKAAERLMALDVLRQELMRLADLEIPVAKLCTRIDSYGVYQAFPDTTFVAGQSHYMYLYAELRNFTVKSEGGVFRTYLNIQHVLYDEQGQVALPPQVDKDVADISANRRTDFYITRLLILPPTLKPGAYTLKVTVEDPAANKVKTVNVPITLAKPG